MAPIKYIIITLIYTLATLSTCEPFLVGPAQGFTPRDEIVQGWALVEIYCPDGTARCGQRACCPIGSYCDSSEANSNLCCPTRTPCAYDVSIADRCAVSTWVEWFTSEDPICCLSGQIGVQPGPHDYYGSCASVGSDVPFSMLASTVSSPSIVAATTVATSSSPSASASSVASEKSASSTSISFSSSAPIKSASAGTIASSSVGNTSPSSSSLIASTSTGAANAKSSVNGGWSTLLGVVGGIIGFEIF